MRQRWFLFLTTFCLFVSSCSSASDGTGPGDSTTFFRARIGGAAWSAASTSLTLGAIRGAPGLYSITALEIGGSGTGLVLQLYNIGAPGTYTLGMGVQMFGGTGTLSRVGSDGWSTPLNGAAGQLVLSVLTETRIAGTFAFTAKSFTGASTLEVTNGEFDLPVTQFSAIGPLPLSAGSRFSGTIGAAAYNASGAQVNLSTGQVPILTLVSNNGERTVVFSLADMTGPGVYTLSSNTPVRSIQTSGIPGNLLPTWGSQVGGGSGSVTVTAVTASRITGTFTGTLGAVAGGATGTVTVSGTFDMGRFGGP